MCGRFSFVPTGHQSETSLRGITLPAEVCFSYHIAPSERACVITSDMPNALQPMQWGLVPNWNPVGRASKRIINARAETLLQKPTFRDSAQRRRCIVPADSFYEWRLQADGQRKPYRIIDADGSLLFMAGLWEEWPDTEGPNRTFVIVTVPASSDLSELHNRMPALLFGEAERHRWLSANTPAQRLMSLLRPAPEGRLSWYRVSIRLNKPSFKEPSLHEPAFD